MSRCATIVILTLVSSLSFADAPSPIFSGTEKAATNLEQVLGSFIEIVNQGSQSTEHCAAFAVDSDLFEIEALVARNTLVCDDIQPAGNLRARVRNASDFQVVAGTDVDLPDPGSGDFETVKALIPQALNGQYLFCVYSTGVSEAAAFYLLEDSGGEFGGVSIRDGQPQSMARDTMIFIRQKVGLDSNRPPVAIAGPDQVIDVRPCDASGDPLTPRTVSLHGVRSFDPDGDQPLAYAWSGGNFTNPNGPVTDVTIAQGGDHFFALRVADGFTGEDTDPATIRALCAQQVDPFPTIESIRPVPNGPAPEMCNPEDPPCPIHRDDTTNDVQFCASRAPLPGGGEKFVWQFAHCDPGSCVIAETTSSQCVAEDPSSLWTIGGYDPDNQTQTASLRVVDSLTSQLETSESQADLTISPPPDVQFDCRTPEWIQADNVPFNFEFKADATVANNKVWLNEIAYDFRVTGGLSDAHPDTPISSLPPDEKETKHYRFEDKHHWDGSFCWSLSPSFAPLGFTVSGGVSQFEDVNNFVFNPIPPLCTTSIGPTDDKEESYWDAATCWWTMTAATVICGYRCGVLFPCQLAWFAIATATGYACKQVCDEAQDPIKPDPNYQMRVRPADSPMAPPDFFPRSDPFFKYAEGVAPRGPGYQGFRDAYDLARARLAGALLANNDGWVATHAADVLRYGAWAAEAGEDHVAALQNIPADFQSLTDADFNDIIQQAQGGSLPQELQDALAGSGATQAQIDQAIVAIAKSTAATARNAVQQPFDQGAKRPHFRDFLMDQAYFSTPSGRLTVAVTSPREDHFVRGTVTIDARLADKTVGNAPQCQPTKVVDLEIQPPPPAPPIILPPLLPQAWDTTDLPDGTYTITIRAISRSDDPVNPVNLVTDTIPVFVDNHPPVISLTSPERRSYSLADSPVSIQATLSDSQDPSPVIQEAFLDDEFWWIPEIDLLLLDSGQHTLRLVAADKAGNVSEKAIRFTLGSLSFRDDDGSRESMVKIDFSDDSATKSIEIPDILTTAVEARVWVFGQALDRAAPSYDYVLSITGRVPQEIRFDVSAFGGDDYQWVSFLIPRLGDLAPGTHLVTITEDGSGSRLTNNLAVGIDTNTDFNHSTWIQDGQVCSPPCDGELMMFLEIVPAETVPALSVWGVVILVAFLAAGGAIMAWRLRMA